MKRGLILVLPMVSMLWLVSCASEAPLKTDTVTGGLEALAWLAGSWAGAEEHGPRTEEHWTKPAGRSMFGVNRTLTDGETIFFEFLRLEESGEGEIIYYAAPKGRHPPTPFRLIETAGERFVFENPDHDFPQRIIYTRQADDSLLQRIEGEESGRALSSEWRLHRAE